MAVLPISLSADTVRLLAKTSLFQGLEAAVIQELAQHLHCIQLPRGEVLIRQNDPGSCLYILLNGRLRVYINQSDGSEMLVGEIAPGETVGEMALLSDEIRSGTVRAVRDSQLVVFSKQAFESMMATNPLAMVKVTRQIVSRLQRRNKSDDLKSVLSIAVVPAGAGPTLSSFACRLAESLSQWGTTLHLNSDHITKHFLHGRDQDLPRQFGDKLLSWLNDEESKYQYVVYESDSTFTEWTHHCLAQADHVLFVGRSRSDPALNQVEAEIHCRASLLADTYTSFILLHSNDSNLGQGEMAYWLRIRKPKAYYHLCPDSIHDMQRFTRLLTQQAVGLVLGGGGARGLSHIGILRAIRESGLFVDAIGGTSMGAVVSALYALRVDHQTMTETCKTLFAKQRGFLDLTFPFVSIMTGERITGGLEKLFGGIQIEDLRLPYFCASSNLSRAQVMVHREGPLWRALRASLSLPGILPPVYHNGDLLVDGGLLNNLPIDVLRSNYPVRTVIASDVRLKVDLVQDAPFPERLSGWEILAHRINPFGRRSALPNIQSILMRATMLSSSNKDELASKTADLCFRPPVAKFRLLDFKAMDELVEVGYRYALKRLEDWISSKEAPSI